MSGLCSLEKKRSRESGQIKRNFNKFSVMEILILLDTAGLMPSRHYLLDINLYSASSCGFLRLSLSPFHASWTQLWWLEFKTLNVALGLSSEVPWKGQWFSTQMLHKGAFVVSSQRSRRGPQLCRFLNFHGRWVSLSALPTPVLTICVFFQCPKRNWWYMKLHDPRHCILDQAYLEWPPDLC